MIRVLVGMALLGLSSCYQMSDDDLRGVSVTNNPSIVPSHGSMSQFTAMHP